MVLNYRTHGIIGGLRSRKEVEFILEGKPTGKGRPRFTSRGGFVRTYTPNTTAQYEKEIAKMFNTQCNISESDIEREIHIEIEAVFEPPKSTSKKEKIRLLNGVGYMHKPDIDNIGKIILDGLNKVAYNDDAQVTKMSINKNYGVNSYVKVKIIYLGE